MAVITPQTVSATAGAVLTYAAASGGGDTFVNDGSSILHVKNGGGGSINVTIDSVTPCDQAFDHDLVLAVAAGAERVFPKLPASRFGSTVSVTYSGVTTVTVAVAKYV